MSTLAKTFHFSPVEKPINNGCNVNFDDIVKYINDRNDGTETWDQLRVSGTSVLGSGGLATNATTGFVYIGGCAGVPNGTPITLSGRIPLVADTTNGDLYFYSSVLGAWKLVNGYY